MRLTYNPKLSGSIVCLKSSGSAVHFSLPQNGCSIPSTTKLLNCTGGLFLLFQNNWIFSCKFESCLTADYPYRGTVGGEFSELLRHFFWLSSLNHLLPKITVQQDFSWVTIEWKMARLQYIPIKVWIWMCLDEPDPQTENRQSMSHHTDVPLVSVKHVFVFFWSCAVHPCPPFIYPLKILNLVCVQSVFAFFKVGEEIH